MQKKKKTQRVARFLQLGQCKDIVRLMYSGVLSPVCLPTDLMVPPPISSSSGFSFDGGKNAPWVDEIRGRPVHNISYVSRVARNA